MSSDYTQPKHGRLVVISAPSGTGKSTVLKKVLQLRPEFVFSVSATTRSQRPHEVDGREYSFLTRSEFEEMISKGDFFEWAEYVGNYYGTPKMPIIENLKCGKTVMLDIEIQGAKQVMKQAEDAVSIFIVPPDMKELEKRLRGRGTDTEEQLLARMDRAKLELEEKKRYDYIVINDDASRAAEEIVNILER